MSAPVTWAFYTTLYRGGGPRNARVAQTFARERRAEGQTVILDRVESKADVLAALARLRKRGLLVDELHFFGHSGMYGPMFRTAEHPEQFSPEEWRQLVGQIPFAPQARGAWFHACRTARWFAPFFARTFGVPAHGYHWYTTFSTHPRRFAWEPRAQGDGPLYLLGCPGRKSHGLLGSAKKYLTHPPGEAFKRFEPTPVGDEASYRYVAKAYDRVFTDIRVREAEYAWLREALTAQPGGRVLDIGCGNGALLRALCDDGLAQEGQGVDASAAMIHQAQLRQADRAQLAFQTIDGPRLPFPDNHFDTVTSLLSWRYLDWDPRLAEIHRVLRPGGQLLIVDMVTAPVRLNEWPQLLRDTAAGVAQRRRHAGFHAHLKALVGDPAWQEMLRYNPIRSEHEMTWYLESRFPGRTVERLNIGRHARILAFASGPIHGQAPAPMSYP